MCGSLKLTEFLFLVYFHFGACHWPILVFRLKRASYFCTTAQWSAMLAHSKKVPGSNPNQGTLLCYPNTITSGFKN